MKSKNRLPLILLIVVLLVVVIAAVVLALVLSKQSDEDALTPETTDELTRTRWFITDWYSELAEKGDCQVYLNELRFEGGKYTLTTAKDRIRAVYPRGERFFKLEQVTKVEFF